MSELAQTSEAIPVFFTWTVNIVPVDPSPAPTAVIIDPLNNYSSLPLTKQGTGATTRYFANVVESVAGEYEIRATTTDPTVDSHTYQEFVRVGQVWLEDLDATVSGIPTNPLLTSDVRLPSGSTPISTLTQAQILTDATPFPGADIALIKAKTDLITTPLTLSQIVNGVWNELLAGHTTPNSAAQYLITAGSGGGAPTIQEIVDGVLNELLASHTTAGSVAVAIALINAVYAAVETIGAGVTYIRNPVSANADTELRQGVRYTGVYALHYTSDSAANLLAVGITVALNFAGLSFTASSVTGSAGAWDIYIGISEVQTAAIVLGTYEAQLALYDTGVEVPELSNFRVTISPNP